MEPICKHRSIRHQVYCILTAEYKYLSIPRQSTSPHPFSRSPAHSLAARSSSRSIATSIAEQNRLVESDVAVAVRRTAPTQLLHRPRQHLLHTQTHNPRKDTYRAAIADLNTHIATRAPVVRLPIAGNLAPRYPRELDGSLFVPWARHLTGWSRDRISCLESGGRV
jgi:hypothetical protein